MPTKLTVGILIALIIGHIVLASSYALVTPYRQAGALIGLGRPQKVQDIGAPDERQHVNYVKHLLSGRGFPVFSPKDPNLYETYQSHQPPLYYVLAAGWCKLTGTTNPENRDSGIALRFLNVLIGGGTVAGVFFLAFWGLKNPEVALTAAAFAAFLPMFTALSGAVSNDPLLILLCTWVLAITARCLREAWTWKLAALIGVLSGLAFLTKTTALALAPVLLLAAFLPQERDITPDTADDKMLDALGKFDGMRKKKPAFLMVLVAGAIAVVLAAPWWVRNQRLYHDPFAITAFSQAFKGSAQKADIVAVIHTQDPDGSAELTYWKDWVGWWTSRSFFGVFGYMDIWLNERGTSFTGVSQRGAAPNTLYRLLLAVTVLCVLGWIIAMSKEEWHDTRSVQIVNAAFCVVILGLFLRFNMQYFQAQARYLLPALGPIACGIAIGAWQLLGKWQKFALPAVALIFLTVNIYALTKLPDAFSERIEIGKRLQP